LLAERHREHPGVKVMHGRRTKASPTHLFDVSAGLHMWPNRHKTVIEVTIEQSQLHLRLIFTTSCEK